MSCLYCGKEVGPIRMLRDSEFCSVAHRQRYRDRLGRALGRIGAAERVPAGMAGFRIGFAIQEASLLPSFAQAYLGQDAHLVHFDSLWFQPGARLPVARTRFSAAALAPEPRTLPLRGDVVPVAAPSPSLRIVACRATLAAPSPERALAAPLPTAEPAERMLRPRQLEMLRRPAAASALVPLPALGTFLPTALRPLALEGPEPAVVDAVPVMDHIPAVHPATVSLLRFALAVVEDGRPAYETAPPCGTPAAAPLESMPALAAYAVAVGASGSALRQPAWEWDGGLSVPRRLAPRVAAAARAPRPVAVLSMPAVAAVPAPLRSPLPVRYPGPAHFAVAHETTHALAASAAAPPPDAVEDIAATATCAALPAAPALLLMRRPPLQSGGPIQGAGSLEGAGFRLTLAPPPPDARPARPDITPLPRVSTQLAGARPRRPKPSIPQPGICPLEYHCQPAGAPALAADLGWITTSHGLHHPSFLLRPVPRSFQDHAGKQRDLLPFEEIFAAAPAAGEPRKLRYAVALKIAATIMVGLALWAGSQAARLSQVRVQVASAERSVAAPTEVRRTAAPATGTMAKVRRALAERAATQITDTFDSGMQAWGAGSKAWAPGWQHTAEGFVRPGDMAFFRPSLRYTDYRLEFYGQIEQKSMGWVVRARDRKNYYAMKFTVIEPGLRPMIAMDHYQVVNGKRGRVVRTPLSVMVHNREPYHVAVDVRGNHFAAAIEGEPVDAWTDDAPTQGGVGFFSEPGERARLYWMKISRNQDWLGRVCAYLAGDAGDTTRAAVPLPGVPQFWALSLAPLEPTN